MPYSPTIIAASLNDTELKTAIDKLVKYVDDGALKMAESFNAGVQLMRESLNSLGKSNVTNGIFNQAKAHNEVSKALEKEADGYDRIAKAQSRAVGRKEIKHDYVQLDSDVDKQWSYIIDMNKDVDAQLQHMIEHEQKLIQEKEREAKVTREIQQVQQAQIARGGVSGASLGWADVNSAGKRSREMANGAKEVNYLRQQVASLLEVEEREIRVANTTTSSYAQLNQYLKQLQTSYQRLGANRIAKGEGTDIVNEIQRIQRAMSQLNAQMSRPTSWSVVDALPTKTLDDIAYKIQMLQRYRSGLDWETQPKEITKVNSAIDELNKKQRELVGSNKTLLESNNALARSWNYMKNRLAFYFTVGASTAFVRNLIEVRSQYELNERALGILINSAERGTEIFKELSQMALVSPYTLIELSSATKQLTAYGVAARDVVDTTRRLADMAAAVGMPMERLTYALGQIKAYGYLNSRDQRMFANAGIPLVKQLADYYTELEGKLVSTGDVYDRIKKKAVDYNDVMQVINKMTDEGGKFFNFQAKMADTLKVQLANLTLAWNNMLNEIGASSQGVIVSFIKGLKSMFLAWKSVNSAIWSAAWATGLVVAVRLLNVALVKMGFQWRILSKDMTTAAIAGKGVASSFSSIGTSIGKLAKSSLTWWSLLAFAIVDAIKDIVYFNEAQENLNKSIRDGAKDNYQNVVNFLGEYNKLRNSLYKNDKDASGNSIVVPQNIDKNEANKAWEAMREQIELTTKNSDAYISSLLSIENVSERLRRGFSILDDIQAVSASLKEIDENTIKLSTDYSKWWNAWLLPDGLITNLKDYNKELEKYRKLVDIEQSGTSPAKSSKEQWGYVKDSLTILRENIKETTDSILDFITLKGWSGDVGKIDEVFSQVINKISLESGLNPQEAFQLQLAVEEARAKAAKDALLIRLNDEAEAYKLAKTEEAKEEIRIRYNALAEEYNDFEKFNGASRVYWNDFTKWMKEQHISEMSAMFRDMDANQIKSLDFEKGTYFEWVNELVTKYAKEHKISYDDAFGYLKNWVTSANQWSIFIPLTISTDKDKTIYETLTEADTAADTAYKKIERLKKRQEELDKEGGALSSDAKVAYEYAKITQEIADAQKEYNDALAKGGHSQKENKESAKERKQAESELQKALKDELSLIDKVRSNYKKLTKDGVDSATALKSATSGFDETLSYINAVLGKYGIGKVDLTKYAGASNPIAIMNMLQSQLDALKGSGLAKPAEIKDLQVKLKDLEVESLSFKQETLIKSLNSELSKLKDEYELAVELDANPELGENFATMFGIVPEALPHTIEEYADRAVKILNNHLKEGEQNLELPSLNLTPDDIKMLSQLVDEAKLGKQYYDEIIKYYNDYYNLIKKSTTDVEKYISDYIKEYGDASAQLQEIENEKNEKLKELDAIYFTEELRQTQEYLDKRQMIIDASNKKLAKTSFERLKRSDDYERFFTAIDTLTNDDALNIKNKIKQDIIDAFRKGGLTIWQFRKEIKAVEQQFDKLSKASTIWGSYIQGGFDGAINRAKELGQELEIIGEKISKDGSVGEKDKNWLSSLGNIFQTSDGQSTNFAGLMQSFGGDMKGLGGAIGKAGAGMQGAAGGFMQAVAVVDTIIKNIHGAVEGINQMMSELNEGRSEDQKVGGWGWDAFSKVDQYVSSGWEKLKSGNILGAAMDTVNTFIAPIASIFRSKNKKITEQIEESERTVKKLAIAYNELSDAADQAYGVEVSGAQQATIENKKLQLAEAERQLALERSRQQKFQDQDKIIELQGQVEELKLEIKNASKDIVNDLLGISSAGDEITNLVQVMIDAFRNGEDAMDAFGKEWDKMIDNMILKLIVSQYMKTAWDEVMSNLEQMKEEMLGKESKKKSNAEAEIAKIKTMNDEQLAYAIGLTGDRASVDFIRNTIFKSMGGSERIRQLLIDRQKQIIEHADEELDRASQGYTEWSLDYMMNEGRQQMLDAARKLQEGIDQYYDYGELAEGQALSNLQQGIQSLSEDTGNAIESYLNGISQQIYLHSSQLEEIKVLMQGFNPDVQLGVQSQILLELQNSYQVQMSIQNILQGVLTPSGRAFMVEME